MAGDLLDKFKGVRRVGRGWTARCPAHDDHQNSLSLSRSDGKWLLKCHAGCGWQEILAAAGLSANVRPGTFRSVLRSVTMMILLALCSAVVST